MNGITRTFLDYQQRLPTSNPRAKGAAILLLSRADAPEVPLQGAILKLRPLHLLFMSPHLTLKYFATCSSHEFQATSQQKRHISMTPSPCSGSTSSTTSGRRLWPCPPPTPTPSSTSSPTSSPWPSPPCSSRVTSLFRDRRGHCVW